jgi:hypothetical protein
MPFLFLQRVIGKGHPPFRTSIKDTKTTMFQLSNIHFAAIHLSANQSRVRCPRLLLKREHYAKRLSLFLFCVTPFASAQSLMSQQPVPAAMNKPDIVSDMSGFKLKAEEIKAAFNPSQPASAKVKVKELESSWDKAEPQLRPKYPKEWQVLDRMIDRVIKVFDQSQPAPEQAGPALDELIARLVAPNF